MDFNRAEYTGTCIMFFSCMGIFVYILTRVLLRSEYLCSKKKSQNELPRIFTVWSYKYVLFTISSIFDLQETLIFTLSLIVPK